MNKKCPTAFPEAILGPKGHKGRWIPNLVIDRWVQVLRLTRHLESKRLSPHGYNSRSEGSLCGPVARGAIRATCPPTFTLMIIKGRPPVQNVYFLCLPNAVLAKRIYTWVTVVLLALPVHIIRFGNVPYFYTCRFIIKQPLFKSTRRVEVVGVEPPIQTPIISAVRCYAIAPPPSTPPQ